ncbi:3-keto-disaccharide hydrolase [Parapedobacter pyrenivorans]|uniref:3-keto-disaccharide hydrolase n=1 Tax=Parapedobacter pyrenivorans TaxID=1305674 RepID=UPI0033427FFB
MIVKPEMRLFILFSITAALFGVSGACAQQIPESEQPGKTVVLFDGKTLNGWKPVDPADSHFWTVADSFLTGGDGVSNVPKNTYLQTTKEYEDFEFRCLFRLSGDHATGFINSGIQYRSSVVDNDIVGYQADIGDGHWGDIYDEHRRALLVAGDLSTLQHIIYKGGWNSYIVRVRGNHHELYINGVKTCDYIEEDPTIPKKGVIAFQLHGGGAAKIQLRDVTITAF